MTAALLVKLAETLKVDLNSLSGSQERQLAAGKCVGTGRSRRSSTSWCWTRRWGPLARIGPSLSGVVLYLIV